MTDREKTIRVARWSARIIAGLTAIFIVIIFIVHAVTDGITPFLQLTTREMAITMVAFGIMWLGQIIGWKWELHGGLLIVGGTIIFYLADYLFSGEFLNVGVFIFFVLPGLLFLSSWGKGQEDE